ncbi:MAG: alanine racemase C-terminal domain-containing protein [Anaerocolumna sp.]
MKAKVALTKVLKPGECLSYGRTYTATTVTKIAIIPIGYGDGFPRDLSNGRVDVILKGKKVPIMGRIYIDTVKGI